MVQLEQMKNDLNKGLEKRKKKYAHSTQNHSNNVIISTYNRLRSDFFDDDASECLKLNTCLYSRMIFVGINLYRKSCNSIDSTLETNFHEDLSANRSGKWNNEISYSANRKSSDNRGSKESYAVQVRRVRWPIV